MPIGRFQETYPIYANISITSATGVNPVQSSPACAVPHRWDMLIAHSTAPIDHDLLLDCYVGSVQFKVGTVPIPAGAGLTTIPAVELLAALVTSPNDGLVFPASAVLRATLAVTLGAGETLTVACVGGAL